MMKNKSILTREQIQEISSNKKLRVWVAQGSFDFFFHLYLSNHLSYPLEDFHREMMDLSTQEKTEVVNIMAFRWSGKSTLLTLGLPLWSILSWKKKFILIISQSYQQAKLFLETISVELQSNTLLQNDFDFLLQDMEYSKSQIRIWESYITIACTNTTLRGMKKWNTRPDLIICDDIETSISVGSTKKREHIYSWFKKEVVPLWWDKTKIILLWNYLWYRCFLERLWEEMRKEVLSWVTKKYPIKNEDKEILWKGKYSEKDIEEIRKRVGNKETWSNEFLIQWVPYEGNPLQESDFSFSYWSPRKRVVDRKNAWVYISPTKVDSTRWKVLVCWATIFWINNEIQICLHPNYVYKRMEDKEVVATAVKLLNRNMITKRRWIYYNRENIDGWIYRYFSWEHMYKYGVLLKKYTSWTSRFQKNEDQISYDQIFKRLIYLIQRKWIVFPKKWGTFIMEEIMKYRVDGYISPFMKIFLEMIDNLIQSSTDFFSMHFWEDRRSPFINCCILDEEFFYADEEVKYKDLKWELIDWYKQRYQYK